MLDTIERRRSFLDGVVLLALSILLPTAAAEIGTLAPYRSGRGIGVALPFGPEADLQNAGPAYENRLVYPLIVALLTIAVWLLAGIFIHTFATGFGGSGGLRNYLKLAAYIFALWLFLLPLNLLLMTLRLLTMDQARDVASALFVGLGLGVVALQIVLLVIAARTHYRLSSTRALGAVSLTMTVAALVGGVVLLVLFLFVALILSQGLGGPCC